MEQFIVKHINAFLRVPLYVAGGSFFFGTVLLLLHLISPKPDGELMAGILYTVFAFGTNGAIFLLMLGVCFAAPAEYRTRLYLRTAVLLLNIPVAIFYIIIVFNFSIN